MGKSTFDTQTLCKTLTAGVKRYQVHSWGQRAPPAPHNSLKEQPGSPYCQRGILGTALPLPASRCPGSQRLRPSPPGRPLENQSIGRIDSCDWSLSSWLGLASGADFPTLYNRCLGSLTSTNRWLAPLPSPHHDPRYLFVGRVNTSCSMEKKPEAHMGSSRATSRALMQTGCSFPS